MARSFSARAALRQSTYLSAAAPSGGWRGALPNPLGPRASPTAPAGSPRAGSSSGCPPGSGPSRARRSAMFASPTSPRPITLTISSTVVTSQCSAMRLRGTFCFFTGGTCRPYRRESTRQQWGVRHSIDFRRSLPRSRRALARLSPPRVFPSPTNGGTRARKTRLETPAAKKHQTWGAPRCHCGQLARHRAKPTQRECARR